MFVDVDPARHGQGFMFFFVFIYNFVSHQVCKQEEWEGGSALAGYLIYCFQFAFCHEQVLLWVYCLLPKKSMFFNYQTFLPS